MKSIRTSDRKHSRPSDTVDVNADTDSETQFTTRTLLDL